MPQLRKKSAKESLPCLPNLLRMADLASDKKAFDIRGYDVRGLTLIADSFLICTATSEPQMKAIFNSIKDGMKEINVAPLQAEGKVSGDWMVLDYSDIICHVFRKEAREFYDLDGLWGDALPVDLDLDT